MEIQGNKDLSHDWDLHNNESSGHTRNASHASFASASTMGPSPQKMPHSADDQPVSSGCWQSFGSCFMKVIECMVAPFKDFIDFIVWVVCCCPNQVARFSANPEKISQELVSDPVGFADTFINDIITNFRKIVVSVKAADEAEKVAREAEERVSANIQLGLVKLTFAGTEFEGMFADKATMAPNAFELEYQDRCEAFKVFEREATKISQKINPLRILHELCEQISRLISNAAETDPILTRLNPSSDDNTEKLKVLKEDPEFRTLVISTTLRPYLEKFLNVDEKKFPGLHALMKKLDVLLKDARQADEWVKEFLEMVFMRSEKNPIGLGSCSLESILEGDNEECRSNVASAGTPPAED